LVSSTPSTGADTAQYESCSLASSRPAVAASTWACATAISAVVFLSCFAWSRAAVAAFTPAWACATWSFTTESSMRNSRSPFFTSEPSAIGA
jgi:hypothetical protein